MITASSSAIDAFFKNNDFSSPGTILSLLLVVLVGIFIFLFNAMAMRRKQIDIKIHFISVILNRRRQIAAELDNDTPSPENNSMTARLECDTRAATQIDALPADTLSQPLLNEYRKLGEALQQALPECRAELEHYNHLVEKSDTRWFTKLCRFTPRERF